MAKTYNDALEWAAQWIEDTLKAGPETNERIIEFGRNMAMTLRAAKLPQPAPDAEGECLYSRVMTVEAVRERRATLYKGLQYRNEPSTAARVKSDLDYLLSIQDSHEDEVDKELRRWQDAIRDKMIEMGVPDHLIDGAGCDSGDPLDFTLAEVGQGVGYFIDKLEEVSTPRATEGLTVEAALRELREMFPRHYCSISHEGRLILLMGWELKEIETVAKIRITSATVEDAMLPVEADADTLEEAMNQVRAWISAERGEA